MRALVRSLLLSLAVLTSLTFAPAGAAQDGVAVAVFEGRGLGHGVGLPLDGANGLASQGASAEEILERFYPGAGLGRADGLVRVLVTARDDLRRGFDLMLPDGGTVRDGRAVAVAPSFPIRVEAGGTVRISFDNGFFRAEVLDGRSVTGTVELTSTSSPSSPPATMTTGPDTTAPGFGSSEQSIWVEPRGGGRVDVAVDDGGEERSYRGLFEAVVEAERLHLVAELDVEQYLAGLDVGLPGGGDLEPAATEAAAIAARSYALRSALAEPRVGRFHLYPDGRSLPFVGRDAAPPAMGRAARATEGRVVEDDGLPAVAAITVSGGGRTADGGSVFGRAGDLPYLRSVQYPVGDEFRWTVEIPLADVGTRLGHEGVLTDVAAATADRSDAEVAGLLGLPSTRFDARVETRAEAPPERTDSPPFQELPGPPRPAALDAAADGGGIPWTAVVTAALSLAVAVVVLRVADVQRRVQAARARRAARRSHPTEPRDEPVAPPQPTAQPEPAAVTQPIWANEPEWLADMMAGRTPPPDERRESQPSPPVEVIPDEEPPRTRPLSEVLGWDDAPDWLDEPDERSTP